MTIDQIIDGIIVREGEYVNNPNDAGGPTRWGITQEVARRDGYFGEMRLLARERAASIYRKRYVAAPGFDLVAEIDANVAAELVDTGVNMGATVAGRFLQRALNAFNRQGRDYADVAADGDVGPTTRTVLAAFLRLRGDKGRVVLLRALNGLQCARYIELAEGRAANEAFTFGWIAERVA